MLLDKANPTSGLARGAAQISHSLTNSKEATILDRIEGQIEFGNDKVTTIHAQLSSVLCGLRGESNQIEKDSGHPIAPGSLSRIEDKIKILNQRCDGISHLIEELISYLGR